MRIFKINTPFNWKYIFGEILLIFVGISLAIWFNNWNASVKSSKEKEVAISKIKEEIKNNIIEITEARSINQSIVGAYREYKQIYNGSSSEVISSPEQIRILQQKYPGFYNISDSVKVDTDKFRYTGTTYINLELPELSQIAWETTRSISITNEFGYECLYQLESLYNLQRRVENEIEKAANALQSHKINELIIILQFIDQYDHQLETDYNQMLEQINQCN